MQLLILAMVIGLFLHDQTPDSLIESMGPVLSATVSTPWLWVPVLLGAKILTLLFYARLCRKSFKSIGRPDELHCLRRLDLAGAVFRGTVLALYGADLALGLLIWMRLSLASVFGLKSGNLILVDELLFMSPTLLVLIAGWWFYYPVTRRVRFGPQDAPADTAIHEAEVEPDVEGQQDASPEIWTRGQFILAQLRHQVALILVPLILIMGWSELVEWAVAYFSLEIPANVGQLIIFAGAMTVFMIAPMIISQVWDTTPLPPGELRDRLSWLCRKYRVGVRQLLLWKTFGGMINAAVMGVIGPLRYILLTDALIQQMSPVRIEAVMAHEVAHVRKHHIFWLIAFSIGLLGALQLIWIVGLDLIVRTAAGIGPGVALSPQLELVIFGPAMFGTAACWVPIFGWISRRFERQADTFAVQHLSSQLLEQQQNQPGQQDQQGHERGDGLVVQAESAQVMRDALQQVAELNHIPIEPRGWAYFALTWRHGSIAWRQNYLQALVGKPINDLPIDRQVRLIKLASAALLALTVAATWYLEQGGNIG